MSARWYRVKPADVEAIQWDPVDNLDTTLAQFAEWAVNYELELKRNRNGIESAALSIATAKEWAYINTGDWIVRDPVTEQIRKVAEADFADKYEPKESTP